MSYCLNPNCQNPDNPEHEKFCLSCGNILLLGDRYRALKVIGQGGFGKTFLAIDEDDPFQMKCVIKQFLPQLQQKYNLETATHLFKQEVLQLEKFGKHDQIPELLAHFEQDNYQYLVQEFINGENLAQELKSYGTFTEIEIRELLNSLLPVLQFIHENQVIHRDVKPENIIRRHLISPPSNSHWKDLVLVDFGAAKFATGIALMKTGTSIGSPEYIAPEQAKGKAIFASDLYSLGVTCIHLLTQVSPFELFDISEDTWVWRDYLVDNPVSDDLGQILDKLIQNAIKYRYQSAKEVLKDLNYDSSLVILESPSNPSVKNAPSSEIETRCIRTLKGHSKAVYSVAFSPDGEILASGSEDKTINLWNVASGNLIRTLTGHSKAVNSIAFSPNGEILASGSEDKTIKLWEIGNGKLIRTLGGWFSGHSNWVFSLAFSPNNHIIASGSGDKTIKLWQIDNGKIIRTLGGGFSRLSNWVSALAFSPNGLILASGSYQDIKIWQPDNGKLIQTIHGHSSWINSLAFSPNGEILASGSDDNNIMLWELDSGLLINTIPGDQNGVCTVVFSPNGEILACGGGDKTINLWQVSNRLLIDKMVGHLNAINSIVFSPDGKLLASASNDKTIKLWE